MPQTLTLAQAASPLLKALDGLLLPLGFQRSGRTFRRATEEGITQVVALASAKGVSGVAIGVSFPEVIDLARRAGPDWGFLVGDGKFDRPPGLGMCQLLSDVGEFRTPPQTFNWTRMQLSDPVRASEVLPLLEQRALGALNRVSRREGLLDHWEVRSVPDPQAKSERGLVFLAPEVVVVATVALKLGRAAYAADALAQAIDSAASTKPLHAAYLRRMAGLLGVASP